MYLTPFIKPKFIETQRESIKIKNLNTTFSVINRLIIYNGINKDLEDLKIIVNTDPIQNLQAAVLWQTELWYHERVTQIWISSVPRDSWQWAGCLKP